MHVRARERITLAERRAGHVLWRTRFMEGCAEHAMEGRAEHAIKGCGLQPACRLCRSLRWGMGCAAVGLVPALDGHRCSSAWSLSGRLWCVAGRSLRSCSPLRAGEAQGAMLRSARAGAQDRQAAPAGTCPEQARTFSGSHVHAQPSISSSSMKHTTPCRRPDQCRARARKSA